MTNALAQANIQVYDTTAASDITANFTANSGTIAVTAPTAGTSPIITLTQGTTTSIASSHALKIFIGCSAISGSACGTQVPRLINPTKTATAGTADTWSITIATQDNNSNQLDSTKVKIGTIDSIMVQATVDPTLTFTIAGIANATAINTGNATGCTNSETTNSGVASTTTAVNLGVLSTSINISAQLLTVITNGKNGYSLTATTSGHLINSATGFWIFDNGTSPGFFTAGTAQFGIHACGLDVASGTWGTGATGGGANAKYGWPTQTSSLTLASASTGPIGNSITAGSGLTSVEYAATLDASIPEGIYSGVITYVATPTF